MMGGPDASWLEGADGSPRRRRVPWPSIPLLTLALGLTVFTLTRVTLGVLAGADAMPWRDWPPALLKGLWFDLAVLAVMLAPVWLYEALLPTRWRISRPHRILRFVWLWFSLAVFLLEAAAEIVFWGEFSTRFNFIAVDYLLYTHEVLGNIRESYPVTGILAFIAVSALAATYALRAVLSRCDLAAPSGGTRWRYLGAALLVPALSLAAADLDQMQGSGNAYADELGGNGLFTLAAAMRRNELDYDRHYLTLPQERAEAALRRARGGRAASFGQAGAPAFASEGAVFPPARIAGTPRHVVLVSIESLSASFLGAYGATTGLTPNLDRLAREGLKFEHAYATGTRTVRGLEALSLGTPPVPGQAIVRRPNNDHLTTVGETLRHQGFATLFLYGGYGYFDNMNAYFAANDYEVIDRTDFPDDTVPFENIWGVADEALFANALSAIDTQAGTGRRVFAHIMTTSNHRPYTYPAGRIDIPSPGGRKGAVKYTDYAIGKFIEEAKRKPWFDETLFVFVADHGASVAGKTRLPVRDYRIPLIFYGPRWVAPGVFDRTISQIDLPPSLLDILGVDGATGFFGQSFVRGMPADERAFVSNYQELGYLKNGVLTVLSPKRRVEAFAIDPRTLAATPAKIDPALVEEAVAYYQTASRKFRQGGFKSPHHAEPSVLSQNRNPPET